jgi:hypothetical protein
MSRYVIEGTTTARTNTWLRAVALARKRRATIITEHQRDARPRTWTLGHAGVWRDQDGGVSHDTRMRRGATSR